MSNVICKRDRLLRIHEILELIPVSKSTWWAGVAEGRFPQPLRNGRITVWRSEDIDALIESFGKR